MYEKIVSKNQTVCYEIQLRVESFFLKIIEKERKKKNYKIKTRKG